MVASGTVLGKKYRLDLLLGEGGMGAVFSAENLNTGRRVAVKVLRGEWTNHAEARHRFIREARATTAIAHPNIVEVLDLDTDTECGVVYIVQEFLEGETLDARIARSPQRTLSPLETISIMTPIMEALAVAHEQGIVHRDLKPANLFLSRTRSGLLVPKVIDFGIAKDVASTGRANHTQEGAALGTPAYMSREQVSGSTDIDHRSDIWSLGVVLFELLSGRLPYEANHPNVLMGKILYEPPSPLSTFSPNLPVPLLRVVGRALQVDRQHRFPSVRAMLDELRVLSSDMQGSVIPSPSADLIRSTIPVAGLAGPGFDVARPPVIDAAPARQATLPLTGPVVSPLVVSTPPASPYAPHHHAESPHSLGAVARDTNGSDDQPLATHWPMIVMGLLAASLVLVAVLISRSPGHSPGAATQSEIRGAAGGQTPSVTPPRGSPIGESSPDRSVQQPPPVPEAPSAPPTLPASAEAVRRSQPAASPTERTLPTRRARRDETIPGTFVRPEVPRTRALRVDEM
jgi:serine/threonine-protein kinase